MENLILSPLPIEDFRTLIKECLKSELQNFAPAPVQEDTLIKISEAVKLLGVSKVTLHHWKKKGIIPFHRIASRIYFRKSEILSALQTSKKYGRGK